MSEPTFFLNLEECAKYGNVTRQAVYLAIRKGKVKAEKCGRRWRISKEDYDAYRLNKFNRNNLKHEGEYVFDMDKGHFSIQQVSKIITHTLQRAYPCSHIYYLLYRGLLRGFKKGGAWVIAKEDAIELLDKVRGSSRQMELI